MAAGPRDIEARRTRYLAQMKPEIDHGHLIAETAVASVINPRNTGGWAQYGGGPFGGE